MKLVILGPPGTGKGTIAKFIEAKFNCPHISTGDLLRDEVARKTKVGLKIEPVMNAGKLVEDKIVLEVLKERLGKIGKCFILDGFPRNLAQGEMLDKLLEEMKISIDAALEIDSSDELIMRRLSARTQCVKCGRIYGLDVPPVKENICDDCSSQVVLRPDDAPEIVRKRLQLYKDTTQPLSDFYKKKKLLLKVDGNRSLQEIFSEVEAILDKFDKVC